LEPFSLLVHGDSKVGKTTLAGTCPPPVLILDAEGRSRFLPYSQFLTGMYGRPVQLTYWIPNVPPPVYDGTWDICVVRVNDWATIENTFSWLIQSPHNFNSIAVDSITEIQRRCKESLKGSEAMRIQDWGTLLNKMDHIIRGFRDLTLHPTNPIAVCMFIAETRFNESAGKWKPFMQGQIEVALPYWMDVIGYLYKEQTMDLNGQCTGPEVRRLRIGQHPQFEAGEAVQGRLGTIIENPNVYQMYMTLNSNLQHY
jgi:hypothetical protein